jgi:hypothetical protein
LTEQSNFYAIIGMAARIELAGIRRADVALIKGIFSALCHRRI